MKNNDNVIPSFSQYLVEETREVFFTFGRMNPPTIGHGKLMSVLSTKAGSNPYKVYLSQSSDPKKNPLSYTQKIKHVRKMFPKHSRNVIMDKKVKNVFDVATSFYDQGFNRITMVVGADRITEFKTLLDKYNGVKGRHGFYNFERINVVSAGDRDPDAEGVEGMSASKQRQNASNNDFTTFSQGVPTSMSNRDAKRLFNDIRSGMGLSETKEFKNHVSFEPVSEIREKYIGGELLQEGDEVIIRSTNQKGFVHRCGSNYVIVALEEGNISRQWLDNVERIDEAPFGDGSVAKTMMPKVVRFLDKMVNKKKYEGAVRTFLNLRKKNPKEARKNLVKTAQIHDLDVRTLDKIFRDMIKAGALPNHLLNYDPTFMEAKEKYKPSKHEWGTDAATKYAKQVTPNEGSVQDPDIKDREGTQPKRYHTGLTKAQKVARDRQFKKQSKMRDDDPKAYKPAAGDKTTETKPSKYTKQYKDMYEDEVSQTRDRLNKELDGIELRFARKKDRAMSIARLARARRKNRETSMSILRRANRSQ